jgi:hypothetical protein
VPGQEARAGRQLGTSRQALFESSLIAVGTEIYDAALLDLDHGTIVQCHDRPDPEYAYPVRAHEKVIG